MVPPYQVINPENRTLFYRTVHIISNHYLVITSYLQTALCSSHLAADTFIRKAVGKNTIFHTLLFRYHTHRERVFVLIKSIIDRSVYYVPGFSLGSPTYGIIPSEGFPVHPRSRILTYTIFTMRGLSFRPLLL